MSYLPSKKFLYILGFILLIIAGYFVFFKERGLEQEQKPVLDQSMETLAQGTNNIDSDNDGLKDWEEVLWGTDMYNPDSDSDGQNDKQEVESGYSPIDNSSNISTGKKTQDVSHLVYLDPTSSMNLTKEIARSIGSKIMADDGSVDVSADSLTNLDKTANRELAEFIASFNATIPGSELKISYDNSSEFVKKYNKEVGEAMPNFSVSSKTQDELFSEAMTTKNFKLVDEYIKYFDICIVNMKNITVPSDFVAIHKKWVEMLMASKKVCESIKKVEEDPFKTIIALEQNEKLNSEIRDLVFEYISLVQARI